MTYARLDGETSHFFLSNGSPIPGTFLALLYTTLLILYFEACRELCAFSTEEDFFFLNSLILIKYVSFWPSSIFKLCRKSEAECCRANNLDTHELKYALSLINTRNSAMTN